MVLMDTGILCSFFPHHWPAKGNYLSGKLSKSENTVSEIVEDEFLGTSTSSLPYLKKPYVDRMASPMVKMPSTKPNYETKSLSCLARESFIL